MNYSPVKNIYSLTPIFQIKYREILINIRQINMRIKREILRNHSLQGKFSSLGLVEAVYQ